MSKPDISEGEWTNEHIIGEILELNAAGKTPDDLGGYVHRELPKVEAYTNVVGQDSLTRFDDKKSGRSKSRRKKPSSGNRKAPNKNEVSARKPNPRRPKPKGNSKRRNNPEK